MNRRDLASTLFGVAGLYIAGTRLSELLFHLCVLTGAVDFDDPAVQYAAFASSVVALLVGVALVVFRDLLAKRLFSEAPASSSSASPSDWQAVGFSIVGLYFVIEGLGRAAFSWGKLDLQSAALILFGLVVFLGARGLSNLWHFLRFAGRSSDERAAQHL